MRKYLIIIVALALFLTGTTQLYAGVSDAAVLFLRIAAGARAAGMGEAFVAIADDASTTHWNPAGLGMYPLSSEYHTFELDYNPHVTELALKVLKGELDNDFSETFNGFVFKADGISTIQDGKPVSSLEYTLDKDVSVLHFVVSNVNTNEKDLYKLAVRAVAKENSGVSFEDINNQRLTLIKHFRNKKRESEINTYFEKLLADWQELKVKGESIRFLSEKITFALSDGVIDEKEYGEIMLIVDKAAEPVRSEIVKVPYSLLFSLWKDFASPWRKNLKQIALVENGIPEKNYSRYDIWGITSNGLIHFNGKEWLEGIVFSPGRSTTLDEVVYDRTPLENTEKLDDIKLALAEANSSITWEYLDDLVNRINSRLPAEGADNLQESLEFLKTGWLNLTLNRERLSDFVKEAEKALAEEDFPIETMDRLAFQAARVDYRRLPDKLNIPFKLVLDSDPTCIAGTGHYLWVGTEKGLFRYDVKNRRWRKFGIDDGLPDERIMSLSAYNDNSLWVASSTGLARFSHEAWTSFSDAEGIKDSTIYLVYAYSQKQVWAVSEDNFYVFDGTAFKDSYIYETAVNDSISSIVREFVGYADKAAYANASYLIKSANLLQTDLPKPGTKIVMPFRFAINHHINCLAFDSEKRLWLGTDYGVKIFYDGKFSLFGYKPYNVTKEMAIEEIAADYLNTQSQVKIDHLAGLIRDFNNITTNKLPAGSVVYIYTNPLGSKISTLNAIGGTVYIGTQYGLVKYADERFGYFYQEGLNKQKTVSMISKSGETWFATPSKVIVFASAKTEIMGMHANWLPELADDIYYEFLSYIHNLGEEWGTLGINVTFLSYGQLVRVDEFNNIMGTFNSFDMAIGVSYGKKMSKNLSAGLTAKWIYSRLSDQGAGNELGQGNGSSLGLDVGLLYRATKRLTLGAAVTNIGPDISYIDAAQSDPLPRNLALGLSFKVINNPYNKLTLVGEVNKMLTSLNDGFSEELKEAIENFGFEYWYGSFIAFRAGYIYDQVGEIKTPTLGVGLQYRGLRFDFAYIPSSETVPLANTVRFSLTGRI